MTPNVRRQRWKMRESGSSFASTGEAYFVGPVGLDEGAVCIELEEDAPGVDGEEEVGEDMGLTSSEFLTFSLD